MRVLCISRQKQHQAERDKESEDSPAVVTTHSPDSDAHNGLRMKNCAVHGVNQVQHVILQYKVHVFALQLQTKHSYTVRPSLKLTGIKVLCLCCSDLNPLN